MDDPDQRRREQFRELVVAAMHEKAWSAATLAKEAGVSTGTMTRIMKAEVDVSPNSTSKVRKALGVQPLATAQAEQGYPLVIEVLRDAIGLVMRDMPDEDLAPTVARVIKALLPPNSKE
jgi:lambda repressor-like predicted transcriptional regulator